MNITRFFPIGIEAKVMLTCLDFGQLALLLAQVNNKSKITLYLSYSVRRMLGFIKLVYMK